MLSVVRVSQSMSTTPAITAGIVDPPPRGNRDDYQMEGPGRRIAPTAPTNPRRSAPQTSPTRHQCTPPLPFPRRTPRRPEHAPSLAVNGPLCGRVIVSMREARSSHRRPLSQFRSTLTGVLAALGEGRPAPRHFDRCRRAEAHHPADDVAWLE